MRSDVFLSHDPADARHGERVHRLLERELQLTVTIDPAAAPPADGEDLSATVGDRLRGRGVTFVVATRHTAGTAWFAHAIARARARRHRLIAIAFDRDGALLAVSDRSLNRHHFLDGRCGDADLMFALWRCLYASLLIAA
jgi:hypothetical protein